MNKYIAVSYQLYVKTRNTDEERLQEHRTDDQPFQFITGLNMVLSPFESRISELTTGDSFDFIISPSELYGEYNNDLITEVPIGAFNSPEGKISSNVLYEGNVIPMSDGEGSTFLATILKIADKFVTIDLNHPQSGTAIHFIGKILESRIATETEVSEMISSLEQGCCGCHGGCNSDCGKSGECRGCGGC